MIKTKKQMFTVIGVFAILLMLTSVTYAFFNYTRTGVANNIRVGRIYFNSEQTTINLDNVFPISSNEVDNDINNVGMATIHITGDTTYTSGIEYLISAVDVKNTVGDGYDKKTLPINLGIDYSATDNKVIGNSDKYYFEHRGSNLNIYKQLTNQIIDDDSELLVGYIAPNEIGIDGTISIKAYINKKEVVISDTYPAKTFLFVNSNMTLNELDNCKSYFVNNGYIHKTGYLVNPNSSNANITSCVTYLENMYYPATEDFCRGTAVLSSSNPYTLQELLDMNYFNSNTRNRLLSYNVIMEIDQSEEASENFCLGTGKLNGRSFQQNLDYEYFNDSVIDYLINNNIIIDTGSTGTTDEWVNGRIVLTTDEWNSLQNNSISFKIKVEANEGTWVPPKGNAMNNFNNSDIYSKKNDIKEIYFVSMNEDDMLTAYENAPIKANLTYNKEGKVLAWLNPDTVDSNKYILHIVSDGTTFLTTGSALFSYFRNVEKIVFENVNTSRVTDMSSMFRNCDKLDNLDISMFDTSNVTTTQYMFRECSKLSNYNFHNLDFSSLENMLGMFQDCLEFVTVDFSYFNLDNVTEMYAVFEGCTNLETVNLSGWGSDNLTGSLYLFNECQKIKSINVTNFNFGSSRMNSLFANMPLLETVNLSNVKTSHVTDMSSLFSGDSSLTSIDVSSLDMSSVVNIRYMFSQCNIVSIDLSNLGGDNLGYASELFRECASLKNVNMSGFNFGSASSLASTDSPFYSNTSIESVNLNNAKMPSVTNISGIFYGCSELKNADLSNIDLSNINVSSLFNGCTNLITVDLSGVSTTGIAYNMFNNCSSLTTIYVTSVWDASNQENNMQIFNGCISIVGGNGTHYDGSKIDKNMAVIDNNDHEGYLTLKTN